jgi:4-alpha-glucanotransferase
VSDIIRRAGVLAPLFSVYSKNSLGIGDFKDLELLIEWAKNSGNSIVQLLPMNEVGSLFCPYDSLSSFALEPMYLSIQAPSEIKKKFPTGKPYVDYQIKSEKIKLFLDIFSKSKSQISASFKKFKEENAYWLRDFAFYKVLKEYHQGRPWYEWPDEYRFRNKAALDDFYQDYKREIEFQEWLQWQAYEQFKEAKAYAQSKKVLLKGDLPILVSRDSADVWQHPEFFNLEFAAGAPPDMYAALGQRWGMPTYNWENIAADGYHYLKEKLRYAENFYDILRIDHVVGLFRIWSIPYSEPLENQGLNGFFDPQDEILWREHGRNILSVMLESTDMLLCAEDLGVIPRACPETLREFGILGNEVQRWVKDWKVRHDFLRPDEYRELSVVMLSTHDTTNWPAWWEFEAGTIDEGLFMRRSSERGIDYNCIKQKLFDHRLSRHGRLRWQEKINSVDELLKALGRKREEVLDFIEFYENSYHEKEKLWKLLGLKGPMREKCNKELIRAIMQFSLNSRSIFSVQVITDYLYLADIFKGEPYQYRINTPGTISDKNWSLVMPILLEELIKHPVTKEIKEMISSSERAA